MKKERTWQGFMQHLYLKGFTLIELLVVVLIIGILSSIAVPMYTRASLKSRYTALISIAKSMTDSNEIYYLEHGHYATQPQNLPIQGRANHTDGTAINITDGKDLSYVQVSNATGLPNTRHIAYQKHSKRYASTTMCEAADQRANELCQSLGGTPVSFATQAGWTAYLLSGNVSNQSAGTCIAGTFTEGQTINSAGVKCGVVCENGNCETKLMGGKEYKSGSCDSHEQYGCSGNTFTGGWCYGGFARNSCAGTIYIGRSSCEGQNYRSCSNSVFNSGTMCKDYSHNGGSQACTGSVFKSGAYCRVYVVNNTTSVGCEGAIFEEGSWCEVQNGHGRCPAGSPTKNGLCWDGSGNEVDCSILS